MLGIPSTTAASDMKKVRRLVWRILGHGVCLTYLGSGYTSIIPDVESDVVCGAMEPERPRGTGGIGGGSLAGFPDSLFGELLQVLELFDP